MTLAERFESFFKELGAKLKSPLTIILTGGGAAQALGGQRITRDLDFAVRPQSPKSWPQDEELLNSLSKKLDVPVQYAQDISRWSMISLLDWDKHTLPYKSYGKLKVELMDPRYWSIGKVARGLATDIEDLSKVLPKHKVGFGELAELWARALRDSPPSSELLIARKLIEGFFKDQGKAVWGKEFKSENALAIFKKSLETNRA